MKKIAKERIGLLLRMAEECCRTDPALSNRYVEIARRISMRHRVRINWYLRRRFCRHCHHFFVQGVNVRVRIHRGRVVVTCRRCGHQSRYPVVMSHPR